jgi:hypothetical protein
MSKWQHRASRPERSPWSWRSAPSGDASVRGSPPAVAGTGARMSSGLRGRRGFASGRRLRSDLGWDDELDRFRRSSLVGRASSGE